MAQNLHNHRESLQRDPRIREIMEKSTKEWLGYNDLWTLFELSGVLPISKGPAAYGEGVYVYKTIERNDEKDWCVENDKLTVVPGEVQVSYTSAYVSFTNSSNAIQKLERRVYYCDEYDLCLVHFRFVEKEVEEGKGQDAKQEEALTPADATGDVASTGPVYTAQNLVSFYVGEPYINDILHESTYKWLTYGDLMTLFALAGKLPLSRGLAAGIDHIDKGLYVFNAQEELHTVDWYGYPTIVPGYVPLTYRTYYALPFDPSATMVRVYECEEYDRLLIVHCGLIEQEEDDDYEEDEEEDGEGEGEGQL